MPEAKTVTVSILDKTYQVACPPEEVAALKASADYLDSKMREVKNSAGVLGLDRIAVMAARTITNEYLSEANKSKDTVASQDRELAQLTGKLDSALSRIRTKS